MGLFKSKPGYFEIGRNGTAEQFLQVLQKNKTAPAGYYENNLHHGYPGPGVTDPSSGGQFGCSCATPDLSSNNAVLGTGGPRHVQFGLKLLF